MADKICPYYEWLWDDLLRNTSGNAYCAISCVITDAMRGLTGKGLCNSDNYEACPRYLMHKKKEVMLEKEGDEIINSIPFGD